MSRVIHFEIPPMIRSGAFNFTKKFLAGILKNGMGPLNTG